MTALYDYRDFQMTWEENLATGVRLYGMQHGIAFIGENGTLLLNRGVGKCSRIKQKTSQKWMRLRGSQKLTAVWTNTLKTLLM